LAWRETKRSASSQVEGLSIAHYVSIVNAIPLSQRHIRQKKQVHLRVTS
jgi:hypothetical protein